jgi:signal transduction histidine kinase
VIQTIRAKIVLTFAALVVLNLSAAFWAIFNFYTLGSTVGTVVRENYRNVVAAENVVKSLERQDNTLHLATEGMDPSGGAYRDTKEVLLYWYNLAVRGLSLPSQEALRDSLQSAYKEHGLRTDRLVQMLHQGAFDEARSYYSGEMLASSDQMRNLCFRLFETNQDAMFKAEAKTHSLANQTAFGTLIVAVIALALSVLATVWLTKVVITPAERLTETVKRIGRGRLDLKIDVLSNDEVGQLSREFNKMTERLRQFERLNIERILSEKRKSEAIVGSISDGLIVTDARMNVLHLNKVVAELFRTSEEAAVGAPLASVIRDGRIVSLVTDHIDRQQEERRLSTLRFDRGESVCYFRPKVTTIFDAEGAPYGRLLVLQDVTQFEELDRMKSDFIATLSHEFRTPVTSINMSIDILSREILGPLNKRQKELADSAKEDCLRLSKLARELLQLSKLESGRQQLRNEELDVQALVESSLRSLGVQFQEKSVDLATDVPGGIPPVVADEQQLSSVITNLATNALKHTESGGTVTVRARQEGMSVVIEVMDTGHGIPEEHLQDIFDKFVQVKRAADATPGSVGLGLAIAKEIVEMYGGRIWAESEEGRGSRFAFRLPLQQKDNIEDTRG